MNGDDSGRFPTRGEGVRVPGPVKKRKKEEFVLVQAGALVQCWALASFLSSPQSANPQPNFNFLNPQPQVRNWTFKSLVRNRKSATTFRDFESATASPQLHRF